MCLVKVLFALLAFVFLVVGQTVAAPPWSSLGEAVAIQGYDPVAYFTTAQLLMAMPSTFTNGQR
jgi:hypothetical protein